MNYYASGKHLVVAESFKAAIGVYRQAIGDDPEEMGATTGFGERTVMPLPVVDSHADRLREMADNVDDYYIGEYLDHLKELTDEVTALLADEPTEPGVYEKVADKWQRVEQLVDPDGWVKWDGGEECPVSANAPVEVRFRGDDEPFGNIAGNYYWWHNGGSGDIVAYRVVS